MRLMLLTAALCALWAAQRAPLNAEESRLYHKVESAQAFLWDALEQGGISLDVKADPYRSGFIGVEWSVTTTTLGSLEAKRCATDPLWAVRALRWFDAQGLREGDRIAVLASSSFPGLLYSVLAAAEAPVSEVPQMIPEIHLIIRGMPHGRITVSPTWGWEETQFIHYTTVKMVGPLMETFTATITATASMRGNNYSYMEAKEDTVE